MLSSTKIMVGTRKALNTWLRQFKTFVDFENRMYKIEESLVGVFKWGAFKPLPQLNYVLVFRSFYAKCEACSMDDDADSYYQISLVHDGNRRIITHETKNKNEALNMAEQLARGLGLLIKDAATKPGQSSWKRAD